jgi:hypothetical protein
MAPVNVRRITMWGVEDVHVAKGGGIRLLRARSTHRKVCDALALGSGSLAVGILEVYRMR